MKLAVVSLGGKTSTKICEEAKKYFDTADAIDIKKIELHIDHEKIDTIYDKQPLINYDCVYVRGSHKYLLLQRSLTKTLYSEAYMPIKPEGFSLGHNKFLTILELQRNNIRIPKTYFTTTTEAAKQIFSDLNYPIIIKIPVGTHGKGVMIADSIAAARSMIDALDVFKQPFIIQEYIETNSTDVRAVVMGGKVFAMKRTATLDEIRSNIHLGGRGQPCTLDPDVEQLAIKSAKALKADLCAVDILLGAKPSILEVNLSPGFEGITNALKENIAKKAAKFLYDKTVEFKEHKQQSKPRTIIKTIGKGNDNIKEVYTSLDVLNGRIRLPKFVTDLSEFGMDDDVIITVSKNNITVNEHRISKED